MAALPLSSGPPGGKRWDQGEERTNDCYAFGQAMIAGIDHVQITIPPGAEEAARFFYCRLLGLPEIEKPASLQGRGGFWLQAGDRQVHVGAEPGVDRLATKAHVAYRVIDLGHWRDVLAAH